ncbi:GNAT family N-acetyltransferase [Hellea balneolensis]|uniref:GNAT family N-acetyltransferase n=1 Tax=Hellea balneolensis TaxID=287478 RepID=UPI000402A696|nr:GNAT family N-acetyltransferase [Hellea balneolensis]
MIGPILKSHRAKILRMNQEFVHWLSPLDEEELTNLLDLAHYKKQIHDADGVLIGYAHDVEYDHKNLKWLRARFNKFYYIDRIILNAAAQGKGYGRTLYADFEAEARARGLPRLVCEVNSKPNNPGSHAFHERLGFRALADVEYPDYNAILRYYEKPL